LQAASVELLLLGAEKNVLTCDDIKNKLFPAFKGKIMDYVLDKMLHLLVKKLINAMLVVVVFFCCQHYLFKGPIYGSCFYNIYDEMMMMLMIFSHV
jgi:hypothetical protein